MSIEAMKQLIEDCISMMEYHVEQTRPIHTTTVAIQAAKEALQAIAESEQQEPVAWMSEDECIVYTSKQVDGYFQHDHIPLYTHPQPRTWVGLTDEEIFETHKQVDSMQYLTFGKAIEAKLKEKNT